MFGKQMFSGPQKKWDKDQTGFDLGSFLSSIPGSYHSVVIYGERSLPWAGPLSKFFQAVVQKIKSFS